MDNKTLLSDIAYGTHERHKVDIFIPDNVKNKSGIILYVHGGGWTMGDKSVHHPDAEYFSNLGYICATMNYRYINGNIKIPDELDDITSALKTVKSTLAAYGFEAEKMIISGGSAGGHLSLLYAYTRKNESPLMPVAACVYCPAVDCTGADLFMGNSGESEEWKYDILSKSIGMNINRTNLMNKEQQDALRMISPEFYVTDDCVPTAIFHGRIDELVPLSYIVRFIELLNKIGVKNDLLIYENSGHAQDKDPDAVVKSKKIIEKYCENYF